MLRLIYGSSRGGEDGLAIGRHGSRAGRNVCEVEADIHSTDTGPNRRRAIRAERRTQALRWQGRITWRLPLERGEVPWGRGARREGAGGGVEVGEEMNVRLGYTEGCRGQ